MGIGSDNNGDRSMQCTMQCTPELEDRGRSTGPGVGSWSRGLWTRPDEWRMKSHQARCGLACDPRLPWRGSWQGWEGGPVWGSVSVGVRLGWMRIMRGTGLGFMIGSE